jgi:SNF2 family DNA or RNA helicase
MWLEEIDGWTDEELFDSVHLNTVVEFIHDVIEKSQQRIVVFSNYLRYLDLIALALRRKFKIQALRFDGTIPQAKRGEVQRHFATEGNTKPILITAGAGGVGLNLTSGLVMIQTEEWCNTNAVAQAICRLHSQLQEKEVVVVKFHIPNSAIDGQISRVRRAKTIVNNQLMTPLYHRHDRVPNIMPAL